MSIHNSIREFFLAFPSLKSIHVSNMPEHRGKGLELRGVNGEALDYSSYEEVSNESKSMLVDLGLKTLDLDDLLSKTTELFTRHNLMIASYRVVTLTSSGSFDMSHNWRPNGE